MKRNPEQKQFETLFNWDTVRIIRITETLQEKLKEVEDKIEKSVTIEHRMELKDQQADLNIIVTRFKNMLRNRNVPLVNRGI